MDDCKETSELGSSELGTKEYWDSSYQIELDNFKDHGDVGEVWFGESSGRRVIRWLSSCGGVCKDDSIIDLGCGNGMMLVELAQEGFSDLTGVDYSEAAIQLAETVASSQGLPIKYEVCDVVAESSCPLSGRKFKILLDKGTYDAISLHPENTSEKRRLYIEAVNNLLETHGYFIITSCNWTQPELETHFKTYFSLYHVLPTPSIQFGGKSGNKVTSLVLQKNTGTATAMQ